MKKTVVTQSNLRAIFKEVKKYLFSMHDVLSMFTIKGVDTESEAKNILLTDRCSFREIKNHADLYLQIDTKNFKKTPFEIRIGDRFSSRLPFDESIRIGDEVSITKDLICIKTKRGVEAEHKFFIIRGKKGVVETLYCSKKQLKYQLKHPPIKLSDQTIGFSLFYKNQQYTERCKGRRASRWKDAKVIYRGVINPLFIFTRHDVKKITNKK